MKRTVLLLALATSVLSSQAQAQSSIGFRTIGGSIGYVSPEDLGGTFGLGVFADLGRITPDIGLEPRIEYWSSTESAFGAEATLRDISVGARGKYFFEVKNSQIRPFAGAGLGLHFLNAEATVTVPGFPALTSSASETKLGVELGGGMESSLNPKVDFHANIWYGIVSNASQFSMRVGLSHKLGGGEVKHTTTAKKRATTTKSTSKKR